MLGQLNDDQINNVLASQVLGRLACTDGMNPYIVPLTYTFDGEYIYGQTNEGVKLEILRKNPHVCFQVDMMMDMRNWQSVLVYGDFEELTSDQADKARDILYHRVFPLMTSRTITVNGHLVNDPDEESVRVKPVMYRIKINKVTGRFEKQ